MKILVVRVWRNLRAAVFAVVLAGCLAPSAAQATCDLKDAGNATIVEILNTESLLLEDGRAIRLVGALAPQTETRWARAMGLEEKVVDALQAQVLGREVQLRIGERERDRYGRLLTHVYVESGGNEIWVQEVMISAGMAIAYSFADNRSCVRRLQQAEAKAREAGAGFWEQGVFRVRDATDLESMNALGYSFQIVEGRVRDVADRSGRVYLNFGEDWRTDFTATIAPSDRDSFEGSQIALTDLEGRKVRVRGWLKQRNGPMIDVSHPEQIELPGPRERAELPSN